MKLPPIIQQEVDQKLASLSPEKLSIGMLLSEQANYHKKAVKIQGTVTSLVRIDDITQKFSSRSLVDHINVPTAETYFYLQNEASQILAKYPAYLDVSNQDNVTLTGVFYAHGVTIQTKGLLHNKQETTTNYLGEPYIEAAIVENQNKQNLQYRSVKPNDT